MIMTMGTLFVSFWSLCLENLPEGGFTRRRLTPEEATLAVEQAREGQTLLCLSDTDLLAPYHERERGNHEALCRVLQEHFGIVLAFKDFCGNGGGDDEGMYSINPLNCVQVQGHDRLMVVTCAYVSAGQCLEGRPRFEIEPTTVEFHMVEAATPWKARCAGHPCPWSGVACRHYADECIMTTGTLFVSFWSLCLENLPK